MTLRFAALLVCASATGCKPGPTTLALTIAASPGVTVRSLMLHLRLAGADAGVSEALPPSGTMPALPGRVVVRLPDVAMDVAVALDGRDLGGASLQAATVVHTVPHAEVAASLTLGPIAADLGAGDLGGDGGAPCLLGARCSYAYRRQLTIHNGAASALPAGYTVRVPIDPLLLPAPKTRADLGDVRVFDDPLATEMTRVVDLAPPGQTRALWIALAHPIAAGASDSSYSLYYGAPTAATPPSDPAQVFPFWDGFDGAQLSSFWLSNGAPTVGASTLTLHMNTQDAVTTNAATDKVPAVSALEWRARITNPASAGQVTSGGTFWSWVGYQHTGDFTPTAPFVVWIVRSPTDQHGERQIPGSLACANGCNGPPVVPDSAHHWYRIERDPATTRFYLDGVMSGAAISDPDNVDYSIMIRNYAVTSDLVVDWIRARALASPEPVVTLGAEIAQ